MFKNKVFVLAFIALLLSQLSFGQNNTNSPYTLYGYGDISENTSGAQRAMGGTAIGGRSKTDINVVNPASYSAVDSMTFMFDIGISALGSRFIDPSGHKSKLNANLEYLTMQFPITKWMGFSAGLLPYSFTGYDYYSKGQLPLSLYPDTVKYTQLFNGGGGISQVYSGLSVELMKHVSVGVNAYYMFGSISNFRTISFSSNNTSTYPTSYFHTTIQSNTIDVSSFRFRYGLQLYNTFNKKHDVNIGFIYENKTKLNGSYQQITSTVINDTTTAKPSDKDFELPETFGIGLNYCYDKRITIAADYSLQKWGEAKFFGKTDSLKNRSRLAIGFEYLPDPRSKKFSERVRYRAGFSLSDPYYKVNAVVPPKNFGITLGVGIPLKNSKTVLNTSIEYGKIGSSTMLREDYLKFTFNATVNENWFFKRKL